MLMNNIMDIKYPRWLQLCCGDYIYANKYIIIKGAFYRLKKRKKLLHFRFLNKPSLVSFVLPVSRKNEK